MNILFYKTNSRYYHSWYKVLKRIILRLLLDFSKEFSIPIDSDVPNPFVAEKVIFFLFELSKTNSVTAMQYHLQHTYQDITADSIIYFTNGEKSLK